MAEPVLEAQNVSKAYGHGKTAVHVLANLDLSLDAGEFVVLLGPSGSGKSTLLNILGLMDAPDSGEVRLCGRATRKLDSEDRARLRNEKLGFVFQFDSLLPEFTVLENITMPRRIALAHGRKGESLAQANQRALQLLSGFGLAKLGKRFPFEISGGERQRVALCRAIISAPAVLLADEPTGNLDKQNAELVFKDLRDLSQDRGVAVLMATHNEEACRYSTKVVHLRDGVIAPEAKAP